MRDLGRPRGHGPRSGSASSPAVDLFGESPSRLVVTARPRHAPALVLLARQHGLPVEELGVGRRRSARHRARRRRRATGAAEERGARVADADLTSPVPISATPGITGWRGPRLGPASAGGAADDVRRVRRVLAAAGIRDGGGGGRRARPVRAPAPRPGIGRPGGQRRRAADALQGPRDDLARSSTSGACRRSAATWRSPTAATRRPARRSGRTPSRRSASGRGGRVAIGHNGNLVNTRELLAQLDGGRGRLPASTDTELLTALLADEPATDTVEALLQRPAARPRRLLAGRPRRGPDHRGPRSARLPAARARSDPGRRRADGHAAACGAMTPRRRPATPGSSRRRRPASTSSAPSTSGTSSRARSSSSSRAASRVRSGSPRRRRRCASSSSSTSPGPIRTWRAATCTRSAAGWACSWPTSTRSTTDLVMPVPDTGAPAAAGYAEASGIPFREGLVRNRYTGRTFIQPSQTLRHRGVTMKLNPLREVVRGPTPDRRRRFDRPGHDDQADRGPPAPGRRGRGPRPDQRAADLPPVLLRHRHPGRDGAHRGDPARSRRSASSSAPTRSATSRSAASSPRSTCRTTASASPASTATTRSRSRTTPRAASSCWKSRCSPVAG